MSVERLISKNLDRQTAKSRAARRVGLIGTALCFSVMVVAIATERGFNQTIENRIKILLSDFRAVPNDTWIGTSSVAELDTEFENQALAIKGVERVFATLDEPAVAQNPDGSVHGIMLRGVDPQSFSKALNQLIIEGKVDALGQENTVVISSTLAQASRRKVGQTIDIVSVAGTTPHKKSVTIGAIYSTSIGDMERGMIFCSLDFVRGFTGIDSTDISAYEIAGSGIDRDALDELAAEYSMRTISLTERAGEIFDWLAMLQGNVLLVLIIMLAVALINVASSALIIILESTQKIALLGALGVRQKMMQRIFLRRTMWIVVRGAIYGVSIGLLIVILQNTLQIVKLDPVNYFVDVLPMRFAVGEIAVVVAIVFVAVALTVWAATRTVSRIEIASGLKFE
ncbi:MAG: FtsX-like permease family protein [Mucinivorans sp.]